jgi:hypothetical protein
LLRRQVICPTGKLLMCLSSPICKNNLLGRRAATADGFIATKPAGPLSLGFKIDR